MPKSFDVSYDGGIPDGGFVDDTGNTIVFPADEFRTYGLIFNLSSLETMYLLPNLTGPAVFEQGIPVLPNSHYEINKDNLYKGNVFAVTAAGKTAQFATFAGR